MVCTPESAKYPSKTRPHHARRKILLYALMT
jgi:hypothetical protein